MFRSKSKIIIRICPDCHGKNLKVLNRVMGIFNQPQFYCPDCGYKGQIYVDNSPNDTKEDEIELEFIKENPQFLKNLKPAWKLAKESLKNKWLPKQHLNQHTLEDWCPFCEDVQVICSICKCPAEICAKHATEGWIGELNHHYSRTTKMCEVNTQLYQKIVEKMQDLVKNHVE